VTPAAASPRVLSLDSRQGELSPGRGTNPLRVAENHHRRLKITTELRLRRQPSNVAPRVSY